MLRHSLMRPGDDGLSLVTVNHKLQANGLPPVAAAWPVRGGGREREREGGGTDHTTTTTTMTTEMKISLESLTSKS